MKKLDGTEDDTTDIKRTGFVFSVCCTHQKFNCEFKAVIYYT